MKSISFAIACLASIASCKFAPSHPINPAVTAEKVSISDAQTFDQLIDHSNPSLGTFKQRYWYSTEFWNGTGSPVIVFNPGESEADGYTGYLETSTLTGEYAQAVGGAGIVIEHRYWGTSSPFTELTPANLTYHTVAQAVQDMTYFANNVKLPFDDNSNADKAPWVLVGGSYSGALSAWTATTAPGTFWAYHASSAPVEAIEDYWGYFYPIQQGMPANCSKDTSAVISHVDSILSNGSSSDKLALKQKFGLGTVEHDDDFARQLVSPFYKWQSSIASFLPFCDYIEGVSAGAKVIPGADGVGLDVAFTNFASYINASAGCSYPDCYDSSNKDNSEYTDITLHPNGGAGRQWMWLLCNEALGWWQTGAPANQQTIVSKFVTADHYQQTCNYYFPSVQFGLTEDKHNDDFEGWDVAGTERLMFSNGEFDPWRSAGVSSAFRPGGPLASTPELPIFIVPDGIHVQDLYMNDVTPAILDLRKQELAQMVSWIEEYYKQPSSTTSSATSSKTATSTKSATSTSSSISTHSTIQTTSRTTESSTLITSTTQPPRSTSTVTTVTKVVSETTTVDCESTSLYARATKIARSYRA